MQVTYRPSCRGVLAGICSCKTIKLIDNEPRLCIAKSFRFPGHAFHEKGSQRQIGVGPLVSSQEERALLVPLINRG